MKALNSVHLILQCRLRNDLVTILWVPDVKDIEVHSDENEARAVGATETIEIKDKKFRNMLIKENAMP